MTLLLDRDPEFTRFKAAWINYQQVQADGTPTGAASDPTAYLQAQTEPLKANLRAAAVELDSARDAYLTAPRP